MIYHRDETVTIRNMELRDAQLITDGEVAQGWDATTAKY